MKAVAEKSKRAPLRQDARRWLESAARWRLLSLLFQLPTRQTRRELNRSAAAASSELASMVKEWTRVPLAVAEAEFHRVLGSGGIPAAESSYDPNALAGRGPLLADIAGFHEAFAYRPQYPPAPVPDHIAAEADFLSYLAFKVAFAIERGIASEARTTADAYERFLRDHLHTWLPAFQERLAQAGLALWHQAILEMTQTAASPLDRGDFEAT
ncbi:MAG TPA: molecular chaperone TorD family protein [Candidatus Xenobia bacterium]|nr:molecular chaperone TorD family protein [Candidatus Xenobia bacterium]